MFCVTVKPGYISASDKNLDNNAGIDASQNLDRTPVNWHRLLGRATVISAILSAASVGSDIHCPISYATASLATATCVNGYFKFGRYIWKKNGSSKLKWHSALSTIAAVGFVATVSQNGEDDHGTLGMLSTAVLTAAVFIVVF